MKIYYFEMGYMCGGVLVNDDNIIIDTPLIVKWVKNANIESFIKWVLKHKGIIELTKIIKCELYPCILVKNGYVKEGTQDTKLFNCIPEMGLCVWGSA